MMTLNSAAELLDKHGINEGFIVGGMAEKGFSSNDIDIIADTELPAPFHVITDSTQPQGPAIDIKKLNAVKKFLDRLKFMKPKKTAGASQEYYNLQDFKDFKGSYYIEPKWDGVRVAVARVGPAVLIRTDEGNFIEDRLPNIAEDIRKIPEDVVILDAELIVYIRGKRGDHSDVTAYLHSNSPSEDYHLKIKPFDVLYVDETDTMSKPLSERKQLLEKVSWSEFVHPVKFLKVDGSGVIRAIRSMSTSEGAMIKDADSTYNEAGAGWYKLKWQLAIDARVVAVEKKEGGYVYTCEAGSAKIGKTYATDKEAKEGDIIAVSVDHITRVEGGFTWYAPKVIGVRKDKTEPDTAAVLERMAASRKAQINTADPNQGQPVLEGPFVLHEHWWGKKHHFDLRFQKTNSEGKKVMIGFTLFANSLDDFKSKLADGEKILAKEKDYHAPEWLTFQGEIPPGQSGNPTKNLVAHIEIRDTGHYSFAKRESDFVDMTLGGNILKGRYYARKLVLKDADEDPNSGPKPGDKQPKGQAAASETTQSTDNRWLFWKAKETKADSTDRVMFADSIGIQIDTSRLVDTKDGLLVKDAIICRAMVLDYNGKKILKSPEVLTDSMPTMQRMMITDEHPRSRVIMDVLEIKGRVLPETVTLNNNVATGDLLITDKVLADEIRKGKRDLSPGYYADIIEEPGTFNDEPYQAVQKKVLYDHLAVVKAGRCSRPKCGIMDSAVPDNPDTNMRELVTIPKEIADGIEKDLGKLHEAAAGLSPKDRELVGRFVEGINGLLLMIHRMNSLMQEMPKEKHAGMAKIIRSLTKSMVTAQGAEEEQQPPVNNSAAPTDSNSSIVDDQKIKETQETMAESIVIDGVGYTPEMVKKLLADSAALLEAQKTATETRKLLDAKEVAFADQGKTLAASEARIATLQVQIDAVEQERRAPLIKQITDAMPALKIEDLKTWDFKRLTDTASSVLDAEKLKMKDGAKPSKSIIDDAYAKVGEK
ncbi:MAG: DUF2213 domain-containing protein [Candidatus Methanoperedens sp.]|nr:DUF2213 domain-containing protein [Candidatus Methanoperedens sp.]